MANCLKIISSRLLVADMCVDTSIPSCSSQVLSFSKGDVFSFSILVAFRQSKINNENTVFVMLVTSY